MNVAAKVLLLLGIVTLCLLWWRVFNATTVATSLSATRMVAGCSLAITFCGLVYSAWNRMQGGK